MAAAQEQKQIASRYVTALFALATEQKNAAEVRNELSALAGLFVKDASFRFLCQSPVIAVAERKSALAAIAKKIKVSALTAQFLEVLAENQRLAVLPEIAAAFHQQYQEAQGEMTAQVEVASALDAKLQKELAEILGRYTGKKVSLEVAENPELLGGVRLQLGGVCVDASLQGKLERLKARLKAA